jgi:hypothetical protein
MDSLIWPHEGAQYVAFLWEKDIYFFPSNQAVLVEKQTAIPVQTLRVPGG